MSSGTVASDPSVAVRPFGFAQGRRRHLPSFARAKLGRRMNGAPIYGHHIVQADASG